METTMPEKQQKKKGRPLKQKVPKQEAPAQEIPTQKIPEPSVRELPNAPVYLIGGKYYEVTIHEQDNSGRKSIFVTDGQSREFGVLLDRKVILPEGSINILKNAIYTVTTNKFDAREGKVNMYKEDVPRFSLQIHREVDKEEAEKWIASQQRLYLETRH